MLCYRLYNYFSVHLPMGKLDLSNRLHDHHTSHACNCKLMAFIQLCVLSSILCSGQLNNINNMCDIVSTDINVVQVNTMWAWKAIFTGTTHLLLQGRKEMFYLTTHSTHFIYGYMASDILIVRKKTYCRHIGYSFRLTARVLLYALSQTG